MYFFLGGGQPLTPSPSPIARRRAHGGGEHFLTFSTRPEGRGDVWDWGEEAGEGEASVGGGKEGGEDGLGIGSAEVEEALVFEEVGKASEGGFEGVAGGKVGRGAGGEAGLGEVEDDEAEEGNLFFETGDAAGAVVVFETMVIEFARVEAVLDGVGVAGLSARATS